MGDTMREEFEAWLRTGEEFCPALLSSYTAGDGCITYVDSNIDWQWKAFMAGHEAGRQRAPLTEPQAIKLWHENVDAHSRISAFEWFAAGLIAAERHHGIGTTPPAGDSDTKERR